MPSATFRYACSWSGGKDSALALNRAWSALGAPALLLTMMIEDGSRSRSHGLRPELIDAQGQLLGCEVRRRATSWAAYEADFSAEARRMHDEGVTAIVFGDIDLDEHRAWCVRVCAAAGLQAIHPLWDESRETLMDEFLRAGLHARLVAVKDGLLPTSALGLDLADDTTRTLLRASGIDLSGENGEYHTLVTDMPRFSKPLATELGTTVCRDGYWFADILDRCPDP